MRIEAWSDVVCPFCYLGKRRLEKALAGFEHADEVEVVWRSFQLDPGAPAEPVETVAESLGRKYGGGPEAGRRMIERTEALAAEEGMIWRQHEALRVGTMDAHRLLHEALEQGGAALQGALKEALFSAYFAQARNVADHGELRDLAVGAGLAPGGVDRVLGGEEHAEEVWADIEQAHDLGVSGVPFFVVEGRYAISGAQPVAVFEQALRRAWHDAHPVVARVGDDGESCGPDGCAV